MMVNIRVRTSSIPPDLDPSIFVDRSRTLLLSLYQPRLLTWGANLLVSLWPALTAAPHISAASSRQL